MTTEFRVHEDNFGVQMESGKKYDAKGGKFVVDDPTHERAIKNSQAFKDGGIGIPVFAVEPTVADATPTKSCPRCGFRGWAFQRTCPRSWCGEELQLEDS